MIKRILLLNFFLFSGSWSYAQLNQQAGEKAPRNILAPIMKEYEDSVSKHKYGINVLLKFKGRVYQESIGLASEKEKLTPSHLFNIGSLTKTFTAVLVMQEIEKGTLKLSDPIGDFLPYNPHVDTAITIENLLRHTSGLGELAIDSIVNPAFADPFNSYNHDFLYYKIPPPKSPKNQKSDYCSTNYLLLGYILELINDVSYADLLRERIFKPCNMRNSYPYVSQSLKKLAHPMFKGKDLYAYIHHWYYANLGYAAGCISSTTSDLLRFFENLYAKKTLINKASLEKMTAFKETFGLGLFEIIKEGFVLWGHGGDNISYTVRDYYNPADGTILIMAGNHFSFPYRRQIENKIFKALKSRS